MNDLASFHRLCRRVDPARELQIVDAVEVRHWGVPFPQVAPADIVIEGFGVRLPDAYVEAMAARSPHPVWINLEYLSAESWVDGCHGLPSPHPGLPLVKHFFFPGFTSATGGLLRESGLTEARDAFQSDPAAMTAFWRSLDLPQGGALRVSLFCYGNAALPALVEAWSSDRLPVVCIVPEGKALTQLSQIAGQRIEPGSRIELGSLSVAAIPFLDLDQYDRLLWACDVNFVRGEDSFVRAQFAARPLVWQGLSWRVMRARWVLLRAPFIARLPRPGTANPLTLASIGRNCVATAMHSQPTPGTGLETSLPAGALRSNWRNSVKIG